jgi:hypothetical protein
LVQPGIPPHRLRQKLDRLEGGQGREDLRGCGPGLAPASLVADPLGPRLHRGLGILDPQG